MMPKFPTIKKAFKYFFNLNLYTYIQKHIIYIQQLKREVSSESVRIVLYIFRYFNNVLVFIFSFIFKLLHALCKQNWNEIEVNFYLFYIRYITQEKNDDWFLQCTSKNYSGFKISIFLVSKCWWVLLDLFVFDFFVTISSFISFWFRDFALMYLIIFLALWVISSNLEISYNNFILSNIMN